MKSLAKQFYCFCERAFEADALALEYAQEAFYLEYDEYFPTEKYPVDTIRLYLMPFIHSERNWANDQVLKIWSE